MYGIKLALFWDLSKKVNHPCQHKEFLVIFVYIIFKDMVCKFAIYFFLQNTNGLLNIMQVCKQIILFQEALLF
jgi:hypothetical protein